MGIFTRFRDIVASNIHSILDKAEDPEKMVRLMIQEMEDTLVEVKSNCAGVIADQKKIERQLAEALKHAAEWEAKAELAVRKGREELARAALNEKRRCSERARAMENELARARETADSFQEDIAQLEAKLCDARETQRSIIQRHQAASARRETRERVRKADSSDAFAKFEAYENGIDRLEAEAEMADAKRPKATLREQFAELEHEEEIERELEALKRRLQG